MRRLTWRVPNVALACPVELAEERRVEWKWTTSPIQVDAPGADGEVLGHFENENGRFKAVRAGSGVSIVPDDLPLRADRC